MRTNDYIEDTEPSDSETLGSTDTEHTVECSETDNTFVADGNDEGDDTDTSVESEKMEYTNIDEAESSKRRVGVHDKIKRVRRTRLESGRKQVETSSDSDFICEKPEVVKSKLRKKKPEEMDYGKIFQTLTIR